MATYEVLPFARSDLREIWEYIAEDNPTAADQMRERFYKAFTMLAENSHLGHMRPDLIDKPLRFWPLKSYLIVYKPDTRPLEILRILSGFRDLAGMMA